MAGEVVIGVTDAYVQNSGDQQMKENWNTYVKPDLPASYGTQAGSKLLDGDYTGAINDAISDVAVSAGVKENIVALGNVGINNMLNGNNNAAMIDATQMIGTAVGVKGIDQVCETQRNINQINQEYRNNIRNGMSKEEALQIRNSKLGTEIGNFWYDAEEAHNEALRERARQKREILRESIMQRGYNEMEANYYSRMIDLTEIDANNTSSINNVLNMYHIAYKEQSSDNSFFDDGFEVPEISVPITAENTPDSIYEQSAPQPVVDELANAIKQIQGTVLDNYDLGNINLSDIQKASLDQVAEKMNHFEDIKVILLGHTCDIGTLKANQTVGERRAQTVKEYLMKKGISENRIQVESRDYSEPVVENDSEEHRKQNRRVTFKINENN